MSKQLLVQEGSGNSEEFYFVRSDLREQYLRAHALLTALRKGVEHLPIKHAKRMLTNLEECDILSAEQMRAVRKIILDGMNDLKRELQEEEKDLP
jgi:hypothetical protein